MSGKRFVLVVLALVVGGAVSVAAAQGLKPATKMTDDLAALHEQHLAASAARVPLDMTDSILPVDGDFVTVDATAAGDPNVLAVDPVEKLGVRRRDGPEGDVRCGHPRAARSR
jgi:hypothetical protein